MTRQETIARHQLETLAEEERGRQLLQLALRGIRTSGHGLTIGCWVKPGGGVAGCVFQHAYWQGVAEGAFDTTEQASREIKDQVPERDFHLVMDAIRALDSLGKHQFVQAARVCTASSTRTPGATPWSGCWSTRWPPTRASPSRLRCPPNPPTDGCWSPASMSATRRPR